VGDEKWVEVEAIRHFRLLLETILYLDLKDTFIVPSFRQNLVFVSLLDNFGYHCSLRINQFILSLNSNIVGTASLSIYDNLYLLDTIASYNKTLHMDSRGTRRKLNKENSTRLWHKLLGHISKSRIERFVSEDILDSLDFSDLNVCVECIKEKLTKPKRLGANRSSGVLELIHTNICESFLTASWNGQRYFISFIDDYSRYGYLYLIHEKSESQTCSKFSELKLKLNSTRKLSMSSLTVVVSTVADMTVQENNIQGHLLTSCKNVESSHSTPCQAHLA